MIVNNRSQNNDKVEVVVNKQWPSKTSGLYKFYINSNLGVVADQARDNGLGDGGDDPGQDVHG